MSPNKSESAVGGSGLQISNLHRIAILHLSHFTYSHLSVSVNVGTTSTIFWGKWKTDNGFNKKNKTLFLGQTLAKVDLLSLS